MSGTFIGLVLIGAAPNYLCNHAKVAAPSHAIVVRASHNNKAKVVAKFTGDSVVYICDQYRSDDQTSRWAQVRFADVGKPCHGGTTGGLRLRLAIACRIGWIEERFVEVLSG